MLNRIQLLKRFSKKCSRHPCPKQGNTIRCIKIVNCVSFSKTPIVDKENAKKERSLYVNTFYRERIYRMVNQAKYKAQK